MSKPAAIIVLGSRSLETARRIQGVLDGSEVYGLASRVEGTDIPFDEFGETLRGLYESDRPIVALCAAGIVIRSLAPLLQNKRAEPPVLAVAEDGSAVVPLLGGLSGVNVLAREIGVALDTKPAITTTGEIRFGTCLINPPAGYHLRNPEDGKTFIANLLAGAIFIIRQHVETSILNPSGRCLCRCIHLLAAIFPIIGHPYLLHCSSGVWVALATWSSAP